MEKLGKILGWIVVGGATIAIGIAFWSFAIKSFIDLFT
jgi:hypothetical protein